MNSWFEVRPRRACGACGVYGLGSPRVVGVAAPSDPGIDCSGNPSCVEGGDVEQVCSNLETNPLCLRLLTLSLSLIYILHSLLCLSLYA